MMPSEQQKFAERLRLAAHLLDEAATLARLTHVDREQNRELARSLDRIEENILTVRDRAVYGEVTL